MPANRTKKPTLVDNNCNVDQTFADEADGDEIVREMDVFLSPELAAQIYLLQYPLESEKSQVLPSQARIKLHHNLLEIAVPFPQNAELHGEYNALERRTFQSQTIPVQTHLCIGKIKEKKHGSTVYLVPLNHVTQMRPSFRHITETTNESEDEAMLIKDEAAKTNKPVVFQRKESERAASARRSSYAFKQASEESEPWLELEVCKKESIEFQEVMARFLCSSTTKQHVIQRDDLSVGGYVKSLNYLPGDNHQLSLSTSSNDYDLTSVVGQLTKLMLEGCPIPFSILRERISPRVSTQDVFVALSACAVLVRGNYCIYSKLLALPRLMQRARTFILLLLNQERIERTRLDRAFRGTLSSDRLLTLLQQVGKQTPSGWILKVEEDFAFQASYPDQVTLYQRFMDSLVEVRYKEELKLYRAETGENL
jgi:DNA-directed RNA polymerase-3 subunit RPC5